MTYKTILAVFSAPQDAQTVTDYAIELAESFGAHLIGLHAEAPVILTYASPMEIPDPNTIATLQEQARDESEQIEKIFRERAERSGLSHSWRLFRGSAGYAAAGVIDSARSVDLVVSAQLDLRYSGPSRSQIEDLLYESGRPVFQVSSALAGPAPIKRVMIAWNGSKESARATFDALPFLRAADEVEIFSVDPEENRAQTADLAGAELAETLSRHGLKVTVATAKTGDLDAAALIEKRLTETRADLLVMGAYSHSRLRQRLFGGVTTSVMENMRVATLMSR